MIKRVENISEKQLAHIRKTVGEAFVTNELFHDWGSVSDRRDSVMTYMSLYVDYVYRAGCLFDTDMKDYAELLKGHGRRCNEFVGFAAAASGVLCLIN